MAINRSLKTLLKYGAVVISINTALVQYASAEFTRACPAGLTVTMTSQVGSNRVIFPIKNRSIVPEITMRGSPSGKKSNRQKRKLAKKLSAHAATECINQWTSKAVNAFNSGQVRGKIEPTPICKKPDDYVRITGSPRVVGLVKFNKIKFESTKASISRMRWAYNTRDDRGFYDILQTVCKDYRSGMLIQTKTEIFSKDGECKSSNGKARWYTLICDGATPTRLVPR